MRPSYLPSGQTKSEGLKAEYIYRIFSTSVKLLWIKYLSSYRAEKGAGKLFIFRNMTKTKNSQKRIAYNLIIRMKKKVFIQSRTKNKNEIWYTWRG